MAAAKTAKAHPPADPPSSEASLPVAPEILDQVRQSRALGFRELGMFGDGGAKEQPVFDRELSAGPVSAAELQADGHSVRGAQAADRGAATNPTAATARSALAPTAGGSPPMLGGMLNPVAATSVVGEAPSLFVPLEDGADAETATSPLASRRSVRAGAATDQMTRMSLVVAESEGALQVVAAASLTPEARQRLRRAADGIAAEHGLILNDFTLNGGSLEPSSSIPTGASHGARPR